MEIHFGTAGGVEAEHSEHDGVVSEMIGFTLCVLKCRTAVFHSNASGVARCTAEQQQRRVSAEVETF